PDERKRVTLNGVNDSEFAPVEPRDDAADLLYIGELRALKGVDTLLEAMASLTGPGAPTLNLVGAGPDEDLLRQRAQTLRLGERVRFLGAMNAREAFKQGRALVVPSRAESLPYVVIEAAAAHMPIIATRVGGIPEILAPVADHLIAPDDPAALAAAIKALAAMSAHDRNARAHLIGAFVRERFTVAAMTDSIMNACRDTHAARRANVGASQRTAST
ncbi:MAG: glycosyltransferase, partial [Beijerinckiaceae bacterium]|nr:glycosyltransferase [Beijerinckiaceae bacterium]